VRSDGLTRCSANAAARGSLGGVTAQGIEA
jgi:hypothetical protein